MSAGLDERALGAALADRAADLEVRPPEWSGVQTALRGIRRRRRRRRAGATAGVLVSVVAFAGAVQVGVLPYPSWAPAVQVATSPASLLASQPTKGSLADDERWLSAFREHVAGLRQDESGGESWAVPSAADVRVLFAGDVGGHRLVAIEAPYRWGAVESRQQVWFMGPAGAAPDMLQQNQNGEPSDVMATQFGPGMGYGDAEGATGWIVLTPDDRPVTLVGAPVYAADGTATRPEQPLAATESGVRIWSTPDDPGLVSVRLGSGEELLYTSGGPGEVPAPAPLRGSAMDAQATAGILGQLYAEAGLPGDAAEPLVLWTGGSSGQRLAVLALRTRSGALIVGGAHEEDAGPGIDGSHLTLDVRDVVPTVPVEDLSFAWQLSATTWTKDEQAGYAGATEASSWIGLLGPAEAVQARLLGVGSTPVGTVPLTNGGGQADAPGARMVEFLDASGIPIATSKVRAFDESYTPLWERSS